MKISPMAGGTGAPGTALGAVDVGRTADPVKMERARAIARGEKVTEEEKEVEERPKLNARSIRMRTQRSTHLDQDLNPPEPIKETLSSIVDAGEPGAVEATQPLSPQFAALAKQKRALQVKERELQDREKALTDSGTREGSEALIARIKSQPLSVLQEHGVTYDQLTEAILGGQQGSPEIQALKDEIKALKEGVDTKFQSREAQQEEAALTEMLYEAEDLAKEGDAYELIREQDAYDQVLRLIEGTYRKTGRVLDVSHAMDQIETKLLTDAERLARLKKVQGRITPTSPPLQPQQRQMRTLTARDSSTAPMSARQRAIAAFQGTLRK